MSQEVIASADHKMARAVEVMERDFGSIRTGRASTGLVERIHVDYYGTQTPLNQLAGISVPEPHQIVIQPWDRSVLSAIERAIIKSDIGLTPNVDGTVVRLNIPPLTEERRHEIVRVVHKRMEEARQHLKAGNPPKALEAVEAALRHDPTSEEAMTLRADVQRMLGERAGEVRTVIDDQAEAYRVKLDEQKVTVRRLLADAEAASAATDWNRARRAYENAAFIVTTSRLSPVGGDAELSALGEQAESGDQVVGCGGWTLRSPGYARAAANDAVNDDAKAPVVRSLFVHPQFARQGIARRIMTLIERTLVFGG